MPMNTADARAIDTVILHLGVLRDEVDRIGADGTLSEAVLSQLNGIAAQADANQRLLASYRDLKASEESGE